MAHLSILVLRLKTQFWLMIIQMFVRCGGDGQLTQAIVKKWWTLLHSLRPSGTIQLVQNRKDLTWTGTAHFTLFLPLLFSDRWPLVLAILWDRVCGLWLTSSLFGEMLHLTGRVRTRLRMFVCFALLLDLLPFICSKVKVVEVFHKISTAWAGHVYGDSMNLFFAWQDKKFLI